ncbi:MAG TPA: hypothetical protein VJ747_19185 [Stellaceae bacterium]|nr:hypothetical protein [Stellaceae bacterium]
MTLANRATLVMTAAALGAAMTACPAWSQTPPSPAPQTIPEQHQSESARPGDQTGPQQGSSTAPSGSLSDELSRSGGVVRPPSTGDQGVVAPPKAGPQSTPVIPPPGTPGGNQEVQPK